MSIIMAGKARQAGKKVNNQAIKRAVYGVMCERVDEEEEDELPAYSYGLLQIAGLLGDYAVIFQQSGCSAVWERT
jgi:hypothetical protein